MSDMNTLFQAAARQKFRFESPRGLLSVEDLWDLPLTGNSTKPNLDDVARVLHKQLKESDNEVSFVRPAVKATTDLQARFDIVKHVIEVKVAERDLAAAAADKADKKRKLMELIARKQDAVLESASIDDLQRQLAEL
jgi:hypothetical protein